MKFAATLASILTLCATTGALAQTNTEQTRTGIQTYQFGASVPVRECLFSSGEYVSGDEIMAPKWAKFAHVGDASIGNSARVIIQFLNWDESTLNYRTFNVRLTPEKEAELVAAAEGARVEIRPEDVTTTRTFCVAKPIFDRTTTRVYDKGSWDLAAGILLLPIKMRGGGSRDFDFSKDVTLGTVAGPRWRMHSQRDLFGSLLFGAGITAVTLDPENTGGAVTQATDRAAVTITTGLMVEVNRFQVGAMIGWDQISNPNQDAWEYQGHRWLSIGLGYTLLSAPPSSPAQGEQAVKR